MFPTFIIQMFSCKLCFSTRPVSFTVDALGFRSPALPGLIREECHISREALLIILDPKFIDLRSLERTASELVIDSPFDTILAEIAEAARVKLCKETYINQLELFRARVVLAKLKLAVSAGLPAISIRLIRETVSVGGWPRAARLMARLPGIFSALPNPPDFAERGEVLETGAEWFRDPAARRAFQDFADSLVKLRTSFPAQRHFLFPGFLDLALFVAVGEFELADSLISRSSDFSDFSAVKMEIAQFRFFGIHLPEMRKYNLDLEIGNSSALSAAVAAALDPRLAIPAYGGDAEASFMRFEDLQKVPSPSQRAKTGEMARELIRRSVDLFGGVQEEAALGPVRALTAGSDPGLVERILNSGIQRLPSFWVFLLVNSEIVSLSMRRLLKELLEKAGELSYLALVCLQVNSKEEFLAGADTPSEEAAALIAYYFSSVRQKVTLSPTCVSTSLQAPELLLMVRC